MNNSPLVSVIIPCYTHENYVEQSLNSVFNQTYKTGGYEQARAASYTNLLEESQRPTRNFGPKYWFGRGTTYYVNLNVRF